jgi:Fur family ferric uptake transcriptional regulator
MSCEDATVQVLKESGQRLTPQRLLILSALRHAPGHMMAAEILDQVRESYPYIDASTVYRTLGVLKSMRLVSETDIGGGEYQYEWLDQERHHHLICRSCDRVTLLDHRYVHDLGTAIAGEYGFRADMDHFAIFGFCQECRQRLERMLVGEE